jgi:tetratricopeptide (TPR) repeat protein
MTSFMQRGLAAANLRNGGEAAQWFEKALQENPQNAQAKAWLGQSLCSIGRRNEGTAYLRQAGGQLLEQGRASKNIGMALEITTQLQHWGDFSGALELLRPAVEINSSEFRGFQLLAATYAQLNKKAEAVKAGEQALRLAPENMMMQVFQGSLEADMGQNDVARSRLDKVLVSQPGDREAFRAHKELARICDKLGDYAQVFPHLHAASSLSASLPEYSQQDATLIPNMLKEYRAGFDRELLSRWSGTVFPDTQPAPSFIMGFMRSGTTLTQEVLDAHPEVFVGDEADFIPAMKRELHRKYPTGTSTVEKLQKLDLAGVMHLRAFYWNSVRQRFGDRIGQQKFVDKLTMNTVDLGLINCIFPDARVVFVMRDPRDVCLSCYMQLMVPTPTTVQLQTWKGTANFYALVMDWWRYIKQEMTLELIEFRYEDAVSGFEPTYRKVFDFLGLTWDPAVIRFHEHAAQKFIATPSRTQVAQPLYSSSVARWRYFESEFAAVSEILEPFIHAFDYDAS